MSILSKKNNLWLSHCFLHLKPFLRDSFCKQINKTDHHIFSRILNLWKNFLDLSKVYFFFKYLYVLIGTFLSNFILIENFYFTLLFYEIEPLRNGPLQFCLPVCLEIHRNHKHFSIPVRDFSDNPIYPLLSNWVSTWTEPEVYFG